MSVERLNIESERTLALLAYVLHLVGSIFGVTSIIALVLNYVRRGQYAEPLASHHDWMIRSFWWALVWFIVGLVTSVILIGWIFCLFAWVWYVYRHVRGLLALMNGHAMPR